MPGDIIYDLKIGGQSISSKNQNSDRQMVSLSSDLNMNGKCGQCVVELGGSEYAPPKIGDVFTLKLGSENDEHQVFAGEVERVETTAASQVITAFDSLIKLARLDVETAYENMNIDFIVKDLMDQAGVSAGTLEKCPKLPYFALFRGPRALGHIRTFAQWCGADIYTDGQGKAYFAGPDTKGNTYQFQYGENVLKLSLQQIPPAYDSIEVWGEGAAGSQGAEKYYWLPQNLSGVQAKAAIDNDTIKSGKIGKSPVRACLGAVRSSEAADQLAQNRMKSLLARLVQGYVEVFGSPQIMPGDHIIIENLPRHHSATDIFKAVKSLRVRQVRHFLNMETGFVTRMDI